MPNVLQPHSPTDDQHFIDLARSVLDIEAEAVSKLKEQVEIETAVK